MIIPLTLVAFVVAIWSVVAAGLYDTAIWSLRTEQITSGPYIVGESCESVQVKIAMANKSDQVRKHPPFATAILATELQVDLKHPDGRSVRCNLGDPYGPTRPESWVTMEAGKSASIEATLRKFGFQQFFETGKYQAQATFDTPQGKVSSFPWVLDVIEPDATATLGSHTIPLEGYATKWPKEKQERAVIQQIKIGNRTWLVYRKFLSSKEGGKVVSTFRIAEVPGKVLDLKVEGAYGEGNPLTITYRATTYTKWTTTHVINSVSGRPWTAEEEKHRQEKLKRGGKPAPPPEKK